MPKLPKKNISSTLHDVKWPKKMRIAQEAQKAVPMPVPPQKKRRGFVGTSLLALLFIFLLGGVFFMTRGESMAYKNDRQGYSASALSSFKEMWENSKKTYRRVQDMSLKSISLGQELLDLQALLPGMLEGKNGREVLDSLKRIKEHIEFFETKSEEGYKLGLGLLPGLDQNPVTTAANLKRIKDFLNAFIPWVENEKTVLVLFQNPSELRPSGGFIGSLAEVKVAGGAIKEIKVYDVNEIDRGWTSDIAAPEQLRQLGDKWYVRDSNWFFNYPDTAEKVASMAERSKILSSRNVKIEAVVSLSPRVIEDILATTGPVKLSSGITLTKENFIREIQKDIQEKREDRTPEPKAVLKEAVPLILNKVSNSGLGEKRKLFGMAQNWAKEKDVLIYVKDKNIQNMLGFYGLDGKVYELPKNFQGEYLAVVMSNIGSGKSDIIVKKKISLESQIGVDGVVSDKLTVSRKHEGNKESAWWYRTMNESYFKIFTNPNSELEGITGAYNKKVKAANTSLKKDSSITAIESSSEPYLAIPEIKSFSESGKKVFGFWARLNSGESKDVVLQYKHRLFMEPKDGGKYQFVFDKQSGVEAEYHFQINAPIGMIWEENGLPVYEFVSSEPKGRTVLNLTFKEDQ